MTSAVLLLLAATASAGLFGDGCDFTAARSAAAPVAGATHIVIIGRAGELRVTGARGATEVRAKGTACASDRDTLGEITLTATRSGSEVRIEAHTPEMHWGSAALDFEVVVPENVPLTIDDTSGELRVENVAASVIHDTSGAMTVRNVTGDLAIDDTSGEISVEHVSGQVTIHDTSGSIDVEDAGAVDIPSDGSGSVEIHHVRQNVTVGSKGSGSITVTDIGGDFTVRHKGSGAIDYQRVSGRVDVPRRD
jgi:DUF4097 and DUF4098 domain-containing protein YvlB